VTSRSMVTTRRPDVPSLVHPTLASLATNPQMLQEGKKAGDLAAKGQPKKCTDVSTLTSVGITRNESSEFQKLAAVPERVLEKAITTVGERDGALTDLQHT
jgi:hypothetical protein